MFYPLFEDCSPVLGDKVVIFERFVPQTGLGAVFPKRVEVVFSSTSLYRIWAKAYLLLYVYTYQYVQPSVFPCYCGCLSDDGCWAELA